MEYTETIETLIGSPAVLSRLLDTAYAEYPASKPYKNITIRYLNLSGSIKDARVFGILPSTSAQRLLGKFRKETNGNIQYQEVLLNPTTKSQVFSDWRPIVTINSRPPSTIKSPFTRHSTQSNWDGGKRKHKRTRRGKRRMTRKR